MFFRDLGNVLRHVLRLWFYLSPALYSMAILDASATFQQNPLLRTSPTRTLRDPVRVVPGGHLRPAHRAAHAPDWVALSPVGASVD